VAGAAVGIAGGLAFSPFLDDLTGHRNPALALDPATIVIAIAMGLLAALAAALAPAWSAARTSVLTALSGRRPPMSSPRRSLGVGIVLVVLGVVATAIGAAGRLSGVAVWLLLVGAVLGTLGFGACSPWLLGQLERPAGRLPLASRIALRDTARARTRNGPIVTALLAATAATIALAAYQVSLEGSNLAHFRPPFLPDQIYMNGPGIAMAGPQAVQQLHATAGAIIPGAGSDSRFVWISPGESSDPNDPLVTQNVTVGDAELLRALGADAAVADLEAGKVVVLTEKPTELATVTIHIQTTDGGASTVIARVKYESGASAASSPGSDMPISAGVAPQFISQGCATTR